MKASVSQLFEEARAARIDIPMCRDPSWCPQTGRPPLTDLGLTNATAQHAEIVSEWNGLRDEGSVGVVVAYRSDMLSEVRAEECDRFFCDTRSYT